MNTPKPTIDELQATLVAEGEDSIEILPSGEVRRVPDAERKPRAPLTARQDLGPYHY